MTMEPPRVPSSQALRFRATVRTRWSDEDLQGVLNNAVYLTLFEEGRHAYFSRLGVIEGNRFPFLVLQTNVRFLSPGRGGESVTLEMATTSLGRTSFVQAYRILDSSGVAWCEGEALCVLVDAGGRPRAMSDELRAKVVELEGLEP